MCLFVRVIGVRCWLLGIVFCCMLFIVRCLLFVVVCFALCGFDVSCMLMVVMLVFVVGCWFVGGWLVDDCLLFVVC